MLIKRDDLRVGRTYGHWWIELDGRESYGWWPSRTPLRLRDFFFGGRGDLNGVAAGAGGSATSDPYHGDPADHAFHPVLVRRRSDWQLRRDIRSFARRFDGGWRWRPRRPAVNCRSFQLAALDAVGLVDGNAGADSRGRGCPLLRPARRLGLLRPYRLPL